MLGEPKTVVAKLLSETDLLDGFAIGPDLSATRVKPGNTGQNTDFHGLCLARFYHLRQIRNRLEEPSLRTTRDLTDWGYSTLSAGTPKWVCPHLSMFVSKVVGFRLRPTALKSRSARLIINASNRSRFL